MDSTSVKMLGVIAAAGTGVLVAMAARYGVFRSVKWEPGAMEGFTAVYVEHHGPYSKIGKAFDELISKLKEKGISVEFKRDKFVGVYYDDPEKTPASELHSRAGVILDDDAASISALPKVTYKSQETLQTTFPYHSFLPILSILLSVSKVYPALTKSLKAMGKDQPTYNECIEVYELPKGIIEFHMIPEASS